MRAHQLNDSGKIINTIIVDSLDFLPNLVDASIGGVIGDSFINGVIIPQAPPGPIVPVAVTRRQGRQALLEGGYLPSIPGVIAAISDPIQRGMAEIWYDDSPLFERAHPMVAMFGAGLGMTSNQLDALFIAAAKL